MTTQLEFDKIAAALVYAAECLPPELNCATAKTLRDRLVAEIEIAGRDGAIPDNELRSVALFGELIEVGAEFKRIAVEIILLKMGVVTPEVDTLPASPRKVRAPRGDEKAN